MHGARYVLNRTQGRIYAGETTAPADQQTVEEYMCPDQWRCQGTNNRLHIKASKLVRDKGSKRRPIHPRAHPVRKGCRSPMSQSSQGRCT